MKITLLTYIGFLSLFIICLIYYYEEKVGNLKDAISDYKRAITYSKHSSNADHYTWLQLENKTLNGDNDALQTQIKYIKEELSYLRNIQPIQYESSTYNDNLNKFTVNSDFVYIQDKIDLEQ